MPYAISMMLYPTLRSLLFRLDAEKAHRLVFGLLVAGEHLFRRLNRAPHAPTHPALAQHLWEIAFPNPVGLAAGFDKDARAPHVWPLLGFGFAELGTITAEAQPGNPLPRLFRLPRDRALINRLGFNNAGAAAVAACLAHAYASLRPTVPIGINIGKSRRTPLDQAAGDYAASLRQLFRFADYVVINVSSPNTPGLRDLQAEEQLAALLRRLSDENDTLAQLHQQRPRPLLVKIAPDLADDSLPAIVEVARRHGASGFVATNTTVRREGLTTPTGEAGGLSGAPLRERATAVIRIVHRLAGPALPIIGVGGIFSPEDAYEKIRAGASLVQVYTGMIYEGPRLAHRLVHGVLALLRRDGFSHIREAVGMDS
jgi:dihydroorotate dehydrogenase